MIENIQCLNTSDNDSETNPKVVEHEQYGRETLMADLVLPSLFTGVAQNVGKCSRVVHSQC